MSALALFITSSALEPGICGPRFSSLLHSFVHTDRLGVYGTQDLLYRVTGEDTTLGSRIFASF